MQVHNLSPFLVATRPTSRRPPAPEMTIVVRGTFALRHGQPAAPLAGHPWMVQGALSGETFSEDDDDRRGAALGPDDLADFKLRADVLLTGTCHVPGGAAVTECPVRFAVGEWSKTLRVVGPRVWVQSLLGDYPSEPARFSRMPLGWWNAFGGPGYDENPSGRGFGTRDLPNVEAAGDVLRSRGDKPKPAGFGPISSMWPSRRERAMQPVEGDYFQRSAPFRGRTFDWTSMQAAPPDQQLPYLSGDEALVFHNLDADTPVLESRLPGVRVRAFVAREGAPLLTEVPMNLDTLHADLDRKTVTLTWRGLAPSAEIDLADLRTLVVAHESMSAPPLPIQNYADEIARRELDPLRVDEHVREDLRPLARRFLYERGRAADLPDVTAPSATGEPVSELLRSALGTTAANEQALASGVMDRLYAGPDADQLRAAVARALEARLSQIAAAPSAPPIPPAPGLSPIRDARVEPALRQIADALRAESPPDAVVAEDALRSAGVASFGGGAVGSGEDLSGRDFTGLDLRGRDFTDANLAGAILQRADLRGVSLANARLDAAVLAGANLEGADLSGADLSLADARGALARGASLRGCRLDRSMLERADLTGADLSGARAELALLAGADLSDARLAGVTFTKVSLRAVKLAGADLSGASLAHCAFASASASGARFDGASLSRTSFVDADLSSASFAGARAEDTAFAGANLRGADFGHARLSGAIFTGADATNTRLYGANLAGAHFLRATLDGADAGSSNLAGANLGLARIARTSFRGANLYEADLSHATLDGCDFQGATLTRSSLSRS